MDEARDRVEEWFLDLAERGPPGWIPYATDGNLLEPGPSSGLGPSCLGLKLARQLDLWDEIEPERRSDWVDRVRGFQTPASGFFEDEFVLAHADRDAGWLFWKSENKEIRRAETRQACAALLGVGNQPKHPVVDIPRSREDLRAFLEGLPWGTSPWGASSHLSHLGFFYSLNGEVFGLTEEREELLRALFGYLDDLRHPKTGGWYRGDPAAHEKVNGAMKILTLYDRLGREPEQPEDLIDLCLRVKTTGSACNNLDIVVVLHACTAATDHRRGEVRAFAEKALKVIRNHRQPDGAFSFNPKRSKTSYYGAPASEGRATSDVHGTHLLVWAVTLLGDILGFRDALGWRFPAT